ncbi:MAG: DUF1508 domain-containing protein [Chitinophagaceae bacterium]|nr:DUF1508 domain-containing protein [Chitinophagaceae bacterium]
MTKFEIKRSESNWYSFALKSSNGRTLLASEKHRTLLACKEAIQFIRKNRQNDSCIKRITTVRGKLCFLVTGKTGELIATSRQYSTVRRREGALLALKDHIESASA